MMVTSTQKGPGMLTASDTCQDHLKIELRKRPENNFINFVHAYGKQWRGGYLLAWGGGAHAYFGAPPPPSSKPFCMR